MSLQSDFITDVRKVAKDYQKWVNDAQAVSNKWGALMSGLIVEGDFTGDNADVIDNPDKITSLTDAIANMDTLIAGYDAGIDTNFARIA